MTEIRRFQRLNLNAYSASVILHAAAVCLVFVWAKTHPQEKRTAQMTWVQLEPLPQTQKQSDASKSQRIVDTALTEKAEKSTPDAFLGAQTQQAKKQTVSTHNKGAAIQNAASKSEKPAQLNIANLGAKIIPSQQQAATSSSKDWAIPGDNSPTEYIKGFEHSDRTVLNTKEFVYYGYFKRIKDRLDVVWGDLLKAQVDRVYRMGRSIASDMDHTTRLVVVLDPRGEIKNVQLVEPSGTTDLDDTAIKAFNKAGPFPNPPKGIVEADGFIRIHWDFVLKT